jgi:hypothetical protein
MSDHMLPQCGDSILRTAISWCQGIDAHHCDGFVRAPVAAQRSGLRAGILENSPRRGGRVVEGAALEKRYTVTPYRGFESRPLRHQCDRATLLPGRRSGSRLASVYSDACGKFRSSPERCQSGRLGTPGKRMSRVTGTVGSNPTLSATPITSVRPCNHKHE